MNILLTLRQPLFPADTGGKVRSLNILSRLAKRVSIHAISFADPVNETAGISEMRHIFESYTPVFWREAKKYSLTFYGEVLASQFGSWPYFLSKCNRREFISTARSVAASRPFDLVFCDFLHTAAPLGEVPFRQPRIIFEHNVEFLLRKRKWEVEQNAVRRRIFRNEWMKTLTIEREVCRRCDHVLAVSHEDELTIRKEFGVHHVSVLPTGVDTDFFCPAEDDPQTGRLVFVGSMDWDPNEDGMVWFLQEIYPRIRRDVPSASLSIVGRNPSPRLRALAARHSNVELTGRVADVRPYLSRTDVVVVPLRVGGGTRIKIPEAMSMAKAVVSTTIGAEGLPFCNGRDICIADDPDEFAWAVKALLGDRALRDAMGSAARKIVVENHGWDAVVDKVEEVLDGIVIQAQDTGDNAATDRRSQVCA